MYPLGQKVGPIADIIRRVCPIIPVLGDYVCPYGIYRPQRHTLQHCRLRVIEFNHQCGIIKFSFDAVNEVIGGYFLPVAPGNIIP